MQRWIARLKKTDPSRGHETIHKNIKSSLREIIKGGDPQSTSNTILSCALEASAHLQPRRSSLPPSLCYIYSTSSIPPLVSIIVCVSPSICCGALSFCTCPAAGCLLSCRRCSATTGRPSRLGRCSKGGEEGRKEQASTQFWHRALADGSDCKQKTTTAANNTIA